MKRDYLKSLREGEKLTFSQQLSMIIKLSIPAILAQISSIIMQYIDASMVGRLGAGDSASIGLVSSSTWLFGGLCSAASVGFTVQIAHKIGAGKEKEARNIVKTGLIAVFLFSLILAAGGGAVSRILPEWLGGEPEIRKQASAYFLIYVLFLPSHQINSVVGGMLQCSGNMRLPSMLNMLMCFLDIVYNFLLIFPTRRIKPFGLDLLLFGAGLGVRGAALGTAFAEMTVMIFMLYFLLRKSPQLKLRKEEKISFRKEYISKALKIAIPVGFEQMIMCGAYIAATKIVSPLGTAAIAANSFSVTAESLCYMPGYGIGAAATTIIGQSIGAGRRDLTKRLGWLSTIMGMFIMTVSGALMYVLAPYMIGLLSPDAEIRSLGTDVLRIEAFAEPLYGASIIASGVFRGAGDTLIPSCLNFCSMWLIRLPLSAFLAPRMGLKGVWIAMCLELCARGIFFLIRLSVKKFNDSVKAEKVSYTTHQKSDR